jgi:cytochrome c
MFGKGKFPAAAATILTMVSANAFGQDVAGTFTQAQVAAGRQDYLTNCASCHGADLNGSNLNSEDQPPPLTGETFNIDMANETIHGLYKFISTSMPNGSVGSLSPEKYRNIVSFLLAANGAKPGPSPLNDESDVKVSAIANGQLVPTVINPGGGQDAPQSGTAPP